VAVRVRLTRVGNRKNPIWRVVVAEAHSKRDGRVLETVGRYNPQREPSEIVLDRERIEHWLARGAQPSETVRSLLRAAERGVPPEGATRRGATAQSGGHEPSREPTPSQEAEPPPGESAVPDSTGEVPAESPPGDEGQTVAEAAPADAAGIVDEEGAESATAAGGG
jgi:small subunit ribosomal protein S16